MPTAQLLLFAYAPAVSTNLPSTLALPLRPPQPPPFRFKEKNQNLQNLPHQKKKDPKFFLKNKKIAAAP
jgi:hypothetical protein